MRNSSVMRVVSLKVVLKMTYISSHEFCHTLFSGASKLMYLQNDEAKSPPIANKMLCRPICTCRFQF